MISRSQLSLFNFLLLTEEDGLYESFVPDVLSLDMLNFIKNVDEVEELDEEMVQNYFV
jgi:hypothetical protein